MSNSFSASSFNAWRRAALLLLLVAAQAIAQTIAQTDAGEIAEENAPLPVPGAERMLLATDSPGTLTIEGLSEKTFVPRRGRMNCSVKGAEISQDVADVNVRINDAPVPTETIFIARDGVTIDYELDDGVNEIVVTALDTDGRLLRADRLVWAGDNELTVDVVNENLEPVDGASVTVTMLDDKTSRAIAATEAGTARFADLPGQDLFVEATLNGAAGNTTVTAGTGSALIQLKIESPGD